MNKSTKVDIAKKLNEAADLIRDKGWIKNSYHNDYGFCLVGAIDTVGSGSGLISQVRQVFRNYLCKRFGSENIVNYNDYRATDKKEVIRALRTAARMLLKS